MQQSDPMPAFSSMRPSNHQGMQQSGPMPAFSSMRLDNRQGMQHSVPVANNTGKQTTTDLNNYNFSSTPTTSTDQHSLVSPEYQTLENSYNSTNVAQNSSVPVNSTRHSTAGNIKAPGKWKIIQWKVKNAIENYQNGLLSFNDLCERMKAMWKRILKAIYECEYKWEEINEEIQKFKTLFKHFFNSNLYSRINNYFPELYSLEEAREHFVKIWYTPDELIKIFIKHRDPNK